MDKLNNITLKLKTKCSVSDCDLKSTKKGYCEKHYRRMQRRGTLELIRQPTGSLVNCSSGYYSRRINGVMKLEHIWVAEQALGKELPKGAIVHHVNEIKTDNRGENLVICPSKSYHNLIHARMRAQESCGNANWLKCVYCKKYDDPINGTVLALSRENDSTNRFYHKKCASENAKKVKTK